MLQGIGKRLLVWLPLCPSWGLLFPPLARLRPWATPIGGTTGHPGRARCHAPWCCGGGSGGGKSDGFEMPCSIFPLTWATFKGLCPCRIKSPQQSWRENFKNHWLPLDFPKSRNVSWHFWRAESEHLRWTMAENCVGGSGGRLEGWNIKTIANKF